MPTGHVTYSHDQSCPHIVASRQSVSFTKCCGRRASTKYKTHPSPHLAYLHGVGRGGKSSVWPQSRSLHEAAEPAPPASRSEGRGGEGRQDQQPSEVRGLMSNAAYIIYDDACSSTHLPGGRRARRNFVMCSTWEGS